MVLVVDWAAASLSLFGVMATISLTIAMHMLKDISARLTMIEGKLEKLIRVEEKLESLQRRVSAVEATGYGVSVAPLRSGQ